MCLFGKHFAPVLLKDAPCSGNALAKSQAEQREAGDLCSAGFKFRWVTNRHENDLVEGNEVKK